MASTHKHIRSSTANKRPTTAIADGQIALNTNASSPGLFFKDSTGASIIKIGPVHVGSTAPNATPASGGSSGNSTGEIWLDNSLTPVGVKIWNGSAWVNATPVGSTTVQGLLELATSAETQTGTDTDRAVTPAGLQSKLSDSTSTTSSITIASSTAVKSAYDLANAALPKSGGTITGNLEIGTTGSLSFEGSTADAFETTIAVTDPTADRTITLPDTTGTVVTTGDTGTVTGTMIASGTVTSSNIVDGTIVDADISASAEIAVSKLADGTARQLLQTDAAGTGVEWASNIDIPGTLDVTSAATFDSTIGASAGTASLPSITFTGDLNTGIYSPGADQVAISTNGTNRFQIDSSGNITVDTNTFYVDAANNRVGVGTTSPIATLHADGSGNQNIRVSSTTHSNFIQAGCGSGSTYHEYKSVYRLVDTDNGERLRIDSSGRVGIGTSSPSAPLHLSTGSTAASALFASTDTTAYSATSFLSGARLRIAGGNATNAYNGIGFGNNSNAEGFIGFVQNASGYGDFVVQSYAGSYAEKLRVTSAGNVGIGTTSPGYPLHISSALDASLYIEEPGNNTVRLKAGTSASFIGTTSNHPFYFTTNNQERARLTAAGQLLVGTSSDLSGGDADARLQVNGDGGAQILLSRQDFGALTAGTLIGEVVFRSQASGVSETSALIKCEADATQGSGDKPGRLVFSTTADGASSPTERMRISQSGAHDIYSSNYGLATRVSATAGTSTAIYFGSYGATSTGTGTIAYQVWSNGNVQNTNNSYTAISDIKLKENIVDASSQWADLKALQVRNYNLKEGQTHRQIGLIAQEVEPISPGLVYESPDRDAEGNDLGTVTKSVNYSVLYMKAVKALQEAMERIETLEQRLTDAGIN